MELCSKSAVKKFLKAHDLRPSKRLGQHFLISKNVLKKILRELTGPRNFQNFTVLEIGPGLGTITQGLVKKAKKVLAVEKDAKLCEILRETLKEFENVKIVQGDILKLSINNDYKVVGNLPFYLTAPVIRKLLESARPPKEMLFVVQKEVAQRICAKPPKMNLLAISVQFYSQPKIIDYISRKSFWPQPKVDSALIKLEVKSSKLKVDRESFFKLVRAGFSQPRKKLVNNLSQNLVVEKKIAFAWLKNAKIRENVRAENLKVEDWILLAKSWQNFPENIH